MEITPAIPQGRQVIESYGPGRFRISGVTYTGSVLIFPERTVVWPVKGMADLSSADFAEIFAADPAVEILLIGCGQRLLPLPSPLRNTFRAKGVGCDVMDTGAACRTFNVLLAEARRVAAALIAL